MPVIDDPAPARCVINGIPYKRTPGGNWAPDYSHPGTAEAVKASVDEAYDAHWSIDRWKE